MNKTLLGNRFDLLCSMLLPEEAKHEHANAMPASLNQLYGRKSSSTPGGTCNRFVPSGLAVPSSFEVLLERFALSLSVSVLRSVSVGGSTPLHGAQTSSTVSGQASEAPSLELLGLDDVLEPLPKVGEDATIIPAQIVAALRLLRSGWFCLATRSAELPDKELWRVGSLLKLVAAGACKLVGRVLLCTPFAALPGCSVDPRLLYVPWATPVRAMLEGTAVRDRCRLASIGGRLAGVGPLLSVLGFLDSLAATEDAWREL